MDRHLRPDHPPLRSGDRARRHLAGAGISSAPCRCAPRAGWWCRWRAASISSIPEAAPSSIADPEADIADTRFNDGKTDRQGRFWSGTMFEAPGKKPAKIASLWRLDPDLSVHRIVDGIGCANGLAWSPDSRTMYFTDSHTPVRLGLRLRSGERRGRQPAGFHRPADGWTASSTAPRSTPTAATG